MTAAIHPVDCPCYGFPLEIESIGEDAYKVMSRGHHDFDAFVAAANEAFPELALGDPRHVWFRAVPKAGYRCFYVETEPGSRGSFPATFATEPTEAEWHEASVRAFEAAWAKRAAKEKANG